ncbi:hypothetical protein Moror_6396 [Moniliophthora roreri MCA 2997]|uniref:Uncharacterized protein n=2 Tax=Moniliophthora roreri TaxID=221103 RepID=V2YZA0_MONRO|nr:hypothetical protein Moror_6396 [Moniliophthora roreri MCA 2997]
MTRLFAATAVATGFAVASAQLSQQCTSALASVASNPEAGACLAPAQLVSIVAGDGNSSIVEPIDAWLNSVCAVAPCNNETISAIVTNVTAGCTRELSLFGYDSSQNAAIIATVQQVYPTARKVVCLKDGNTNCVTQTLTNIQNTVGTLSPNNIVDIVANNSTQASLLNAQNITCTNCIKAAYNTINTDFPLGSDAQSELQQQCGASFTDGQNPSGISQTANTASAQGENAAVILKALSDAGLYAFFAVSGVFALAA